jgi:hypothetical protein
MIEALVITRTFKDMYIILSLKSSVHSPHSFMFSVSFPAFLWYKCFVVSCIFNVDFWPCQYARYSIVMMLSVSRGSG